MTATTFTDEAIDPDAAKKRADWWLISVGAAGFAIAVMGAIFAEPATTHDADHAADHAMAKVEHAASHAAPHAADDHH